MSTVITVENLGKKYLLSHQTQKQPYVALRDVIAERSAAIGRRFLHPFRATSLEPSTAREEFWALKEVSFEIREGDRVGIIGRNGAGKSTLLKILSRIVEPTTGRVKIRGRVASLLEVGTGFHPELTGRENIFLNGAILGMTRAEIKKKFDEIVDFAEIEKFLDTPVKRYSSGMYVRLAFAVAANLEPEILLVDEVLAVGDAQFQKKCLGKMEDVSAREGRTVLFVSHNMAAISALCSQVMVLNRGSIWARGGTEVITSYLNFQLVNEKCLNRRSTEELQSKQIWLANIWFADGAGNEVAMAMTGRELAVCFDYTTREPLTMPDFAFTVYDAQGQAVAYFDTAFSGSGVAVRAGTKGSVNCVIHKLPLVAGAYTINTLIHRGGHYFDHVVGAARLLVEGGDYYGTGKLPPANYAPILIDHCWTLDLRHSCVIEEK
jgi:lipopolysaccharide transport system ATP-binding protein